MNEAIGRLERVRAREAWPHEAHNFTPWLLKNADALGEALGMDLQLDQAEVAVGGFSLDLLGQDGATNEVVIIENQIERSDHSHLGQLLTYAGGTDPVNAVWVAESFRPEHRAALSWLNERTDERTRFFAVEVAAVRIGSSPFAPWFEVVVEPNDWQKQARAAAVAVMASPLAETYRRFWTEWLEALRAAAPGWTNARAAQARNWMTLPSGSSAASYSAVFGRGFLAIEIYFGSSDADTNTASLNALMFHRAHVEAAVGAPLEWQEIPGKTATRVRLSRPGSVEDETTWPEYREWMIEHLVRLRGVVTELGGMSQIVGDADNQPQS